MAASGARESVGDGADQEPEEEYLVSAQNAKQVDDLRRHYRWMIRRAQMFVPIADAEDVANRALYDAHEQKYGRPPASAVKRVRQWLGTLVWHRAREYWKARGKRIDEVLCGEVDELDECVDATDFAAQFEEREWVRLGLASLPEKRRDLILACNVEGWKIEEVSSAQKVKPNTINTRLHHARRELRAKLVRLWDEAEGRVWILFPLLFLRSFWERIVIPMHDAGERRARYAGAPGPLACGIAAGTLILASTPPDPYAANAERLDIAMHRANPNNVVMQSVVHDEVVPGTALSVTANATDAMPPKPIKAVRAVSQSSKPSTQHVTTATERDTSSQYEALLLRAKAALNQKDPKKALALVDEHAAKLPNSQHAEQREMLRAVAMRAMKHGH